MTLAERRNDLTRSVILDAAVELLEETAGAVEGMTFLAVAERAGIAQRTVFRYFPTREAFLDAVAVAARERMSLPAPPATLAELLAFPRPLYEAFEANRGLIIGGLQRELFPRMVAGTTERWAAIDRVVDEVGRGRPRRQRMIASANVRYYLGATTWHYYRTFFELSLDDTVTCAESAIAAALSAISAKSSRI